MTEAAPAKASTGVYQLSELPKWKVCQPLIPAVIIITGSISFMLPLDSVPRPLSLSPRTKKFALLLLQCIISQSTGIGYCTPAALRASSFPTGLVSNSDKNRAEMKTHHSRHIIHHGTGKQSISFPLVLPCAFIQKPQGSSVTLADEAAVCKLRVHGCQQDTLALQVVRKMCQPS